MKGKLIAIVLTLSIIVLTGFIFFVIANKFTNTAGPEVNVLEQENSNGINNNVSPLNAAREIALAINASQLSAEEVVAKSFEAMRLVENLPANSLAGETQFFTELYVALIGVYEVIENASSTRSEAVVAMNKAAYISAFDPVPINAALIEFDDRRLYEEFLADPHTSDTPIGIAYKAWYHFNIQNYTFNIKDPYFAGFAIWTITLSLIANQPEAKWRDDFMSYIVNGYELVWSDTFDTKLTQLDQVFWIQNSLLISRMRLEAVYGADVEYTRNDYEKRFLRIIDDASRQRNLTVLPLARLGMLIMLSQKNASQTEIDVATKAFIDSANVLDPEWFSLRNRMAQNDQGFLLQELGEIAKTNTELKQFLEQKGWKL